METPLHAYTAWLWVLVVRFSRRLHCQQDLTAPMLHRGYQRKYRSIFILTLRKKLFGRPHKWTASPFKWRLAHIAYNTAFVRFNNLCRSDDCCDLSPKWLALRWPRAVVLVVRTCECIMSHAPPTHRASDAKLTAWPVERLATIKRTETREHPESETTCQSKSEHFYKARHPRIW